MPGLPGPLICSVIVTLLIKSVILSGCQQGRKNLSSIEADSGVASSIPIIKAGAVLLATSKNALNSFYEETNATLFNAMSLPIPYRPLDLDTTTSTTSTVTEDPATEYLTFEECVDDLAEDCGSFPCSGKMTKHPQLDNNNSLEGYNDSYEDNSIASDGLDNMTFVFGDIPILNRKVINARRVNILEHPYVVSIRRNTTHYLAGSLITKNLVLTVAHPIHGVPIYELGVVFGETYTDRITNGIKDVILLIFHSQFDPKTLSHNILALRFHGDAIKSTSVKVIAIKNPLNYLEDQTAFLSGWGRCEQINEWCFPRYSKYYPGELVDTMLRTITFKYIRNPPKCKWYSDMGITLGSGSECLGPSRRDDINAPCLGAAGAPLVIKGRLVAMLAWGAGCGYRSDMPLIYTIVLEYIDWLQNIARQLGPIPQIEMQYLQDVTQDFCRKEYLFENRKVPSTKYVNTDADSYPLVPSHLDNSLAVIDASIFDIRDFIDNGRFRKKKRRLYDEISLVDIDDITQINEGVVTQANMVSDQESDESTVPPKDYYLDTYVDFYA